MNEPLRKQTSLAEIARLFLKLGVVGFGGPAAHIALMDDEVVRRRQWLTREEFLDYVGATNLIPGPNSTELAIEIGRARAGWPGLIVAGVSFIAPAALIVGVIAYLYVRFGGIPAAVAVLAGVKPVVIAIVVQALWRLARSAVKDTFLALLGVVALLSVAGGVDELLVLLLAALVSGAVVFVRARASDSAASALVPLLSLQRIGPGAGGVTFAGVASSSVSLWPLLGIFLKIGSVLFGSGYVLLAFLRADLVERLGWISERQLLDAVAVGQVTPGPVFTTATFIGYLIAGARGAVLATVGIFLPAFVFVAVSGPLIPQLRRSRIAGAALDGVNVASLALMTVVTWQLGRASIVDLPTALLDLIAGVLLWTFRVNATLLILAGGLAGMLLHVFR
jgi:chromate transporter